MAAAKLGSLVGWLSSILAALWSMPAAAQLAADWMIPAAANSPGARGTYWVTDLSIHNPHEYDLPVTVQVLPSDRENFEVPTIDLELSPWQTVNLWDVLGPETFDLPGTAALLVYADSSLECDPIEDCHLLATSRTYTPGEGGIGEFGLAVPGAGVASGVDFDTFGYAAGILNDGQSFRCNVGIASWSSQWTSVQVDVQDAAGSILDSLVYDVPPFGQVQERLDAVVEGGSLVFYLVSGPDDALVFPYATVINQYTGDASFVRAEASLVGVSVAKGGSRVGARPPRPGVSTKVRAEAASRRR